MSQAFDAKAAKEREHAGWTATAPGWNRHHAFLERFTEPVTHRMIALAGIEPGMRVLDIACGTGQPAIAVAQRVGPTGFVLASDFVEPVVEFARQKAAERGLTNIEFRCTDGEALAVPPGTFDAATMRWGIMFMPNPEEALTHACAALRPGGRIALTAWAGPQRNPFLLVALDAIRRHIDVPTPPPGAPGIFAFADDARLKSVMEAGGFTDVQVEALEFVIGEYESGAHYWTVTRDLAAPLAALYRQLNRTQQLAVDREVESEAERHRAGDLVVLTGTTWIASGRR